MKQLVMHIHRKNQQRHCRDVLKQAIDKQPIDNPKQQSRFLAKKLIIIKLVSFKLQFFQTKSTALNTMLNAASDSLIESTYYNT